MATAHSNGTPSGDEPGFRVVTPLDEDALHLAACVRLARGREYGYRPSRASVEACSRSEVWGPLYRAILDTKDAKFRADLPRLWPKLAHSPKDIDEDWYYRLLDAATVIVDAEPEEQEPEPVQRLMPRNLGDFLADARDPEWLVRGVMIKDQPMVIGGPEKCLKTSILIDLGLSIASGADFLGRFTVADRCPVVVLSGESGSGTLARAIRVQCQAKGIDLNDLIASGDFRVHCELPRLSSDTDLEELSRIIRQLRTKIVIVDPLYLCLADAEAGGKPVDMSNMFQVGPLLAKITQACRDGGASPVLVHHFNKPASRENGMPELTSLSHAGISQFARSFMLVNRRASLDPITGRHQLWLLTGGSAGFKGEWGVDVEEGDLTNEDLSDRRWNVTVKRAHEVNQETATTTVEQTAAKKVAAADAQQAGNMEAAAKKAPAILVFIRDNPGCTNKGIKDGTGITNGSIVALAVQALQRDGRIRGEQVQQGKNNYTKWTAVDETPRFATWEHDPQDD